MLQSYLNKYVPNQPIFNTTPAKAREFVSHHKANPSALQHFSVEELVENPDLWLVGTKEATQRDAWLQEAYPTQDSTETDATESLLVCPGCNQRKVDYYQKQTRGADEPMTVFCNCLNCSKRWVQ